MDMVELKIDETTREGKIILDFIELLAETTDDIKIIHRETN